MKPSVFDLELADIAQDKLLRRQRLRPCVSGNGLIDEEQYIELVAREVERCRTYIANLMKKRALSSAGERQLDKLEVTGSNPVAPIHSTRPT